MWRGGVARRCGAAAAVRRGAARVHVGRLLHPEDELAVLWREVRAGAAAFVGVVADADHAEPRCPRRGSNTG